MSELTEHARHGYDGNPNSHLATSPAWFAHKIGVYLHRLGYSPPHGVRMGRGYKIHANGKLFAFDANNSITVT